MFTDTAINLLFYFVAAGHLAPVPSPQLYFLAATTTQHGDSSYPVVLYRANAHGKLELAREVVPQSEGAEFIFAWGDAIFALHPHNMPVGVAIIHTGDPMRADDVTFDSKGIRPIPSATTIAVAPDGSAALLAPWITNLTDPPHLPEHFNVRLARIASDSGGSGPRVQFDTWSDYANLRREGATGGPNYVAALIGSAESDDLVMEIFGHSIVVDKLPPNLRMTAAKVVPAVVAASDRYMVLTRQHTREEVSAGKLGDSTELSVRDRLGDRWSAIQAEGNSSTLRLFGQWLAAVVGTWSPNHPMPNPGRENERTEAKKTDLLPPTQTLYRSFVGHNMLLPGILTLQNLADGRKIRIETGQEDSEILKVQGDVLLYRVNDTIYQARIDGDHLKDTTVIVKDEDVPEVHWAFWSK
jgi:hypothetical protein